MVTNMRSILVLFAIALRFGGCDTTTVEPEAQQLTLEDFNTVPGYLWFPVEIESYAPSPAMVDSVAARFDADIDKICVFLKPSCSCRGTQKLFPQVMKTLIESKIDMDLVEIWSMRSTTDKHPYMPELTVTDLPVIFILRDDVLSYQILDADYNLTNADTLIANALR